MEALVFFSLLAVFGGFGALFVVALRPEKRRIELWRRIAEERGGRYVNEKKSRLELIRGMDVPVGDASVFVDTETISRGSTNIRYTRVRARYAIAGGPAFRVQTPKYLESPDDTPEASIGPLGLNAAFDERFKVYSDNPDGARRVLTERIQETFVRDLSDCYIKSDGKEIVIQGLTAWSDRAKLEAAIDLVGEMAQDDFFGGRLLEQFCGSQYVAASGLRNERRGPYGIVEVRAAQIRVEPIFDGTQVATRLSLESAAESADFDVQLGSDSPLPDFVPNELRTSAENLKGCRLRKVGNTIHLDRPGVAGNTLELERGADFLAALAAPNAVGVFR